MRRALLVLLLIVPCGTQAQTWAGCAGGTYKIDFLLDGQGQLVKQVLFVEDVLQSEVDWIMTAARFDLRDQTIRFTARNPSRAQELRLQSARGAGQMTVAGPRFDLSLDLSCYWAVMTGWPGTAPSRP